jgi:hypothetical protein
MAKKNEKLFLERVLNLLTSEYYGVVKITATYYRRYVIYLARLESYIWTLHPSSDIPWVAVL